MKDVLKNIHGKIDEKDFKAIQNYVNKNVLELGTDEAFALTDSEGEIRAFKQKVSLSVNDGTLWKLPIGKEGGQWKFAYPITAQGYDIINEATGTCVVLPNNVLVNGRPQLNPFVEKDEFNQITAVYCRAIAFRFSSKGIPQVADWTTILDIDAYRVIDLIAKAKDQPNAFKVLPKGMPPKDKAGTWTSYKLDSSTDLWVNTSHKEALDWYKTIHNRTKKAVDTAQTFARRNASKHLLGLQKAPGPEWNLTVLCWRPTNDSIIKWDHTRYSQLQSQLDKVVNGTGTFKKIEMQTGREEVSETDDIERQEVLDPEDQEPIDITPQTITEKIEPIESDKNPEDQISETENKQNEMKPEEILLLSNFETAREMFEDDFLDVCKNENVKPDTKDSEEMMRVLRALDQIIDSENQ